MIYPVIDFIYIFIYFIYFIDSIDSQERKRLREIVEIEFNGIILFDQIEKAHLEIFNTLSDILNNVSFIVSFINK